MINRSSVSVARLPELARVFVATQPYRQCVQVLGRTGFAVLTGPPEMGKTAIAWMVALARLTAGWDIYDCSGPSDVFRTYDPARPQVFVVDDAFGSADYRPGWPPNGPPSSTG